MSKTKVLYFSATWCPPCQMMKPMITELVNNGANIEKLDVEKEVELAGKFQIRGIPTMVQVDENGVELQRLVGMQSVESVKSLLN